MELTDKRLDTLQRGAELLDLRFCVALELLEPQPETISVLHLSLEVFLEVGYSTLQIPHLKPIRVHGATTTGHMRTSA